MRKFSISILLLALITIGMVIPTVSATDNQVVITYGETCYLNNDYKNIVDTYFANHVNNFNQAMVKIITANEVNKISSSITQKTYDSSQIFSSALVDLSNPEDLTVDVDISKITTINQDMYKSALVSAGITKGHVVVTSPVTATGESALTGVMNCYEDATNTTIPDEVKEAANNEIYTESQIVENSNVNPDTLSEIVDDVKEEVQDKNITDSNQISDIIENISENNNIHLSSSDVNNLASAIQDVHDVQDIANKYKDEFSNIIGENGDSIIDQILKPLLGFFGINT